MAYGAEKSVRKTHELTLTDRGRLTLSGVEDVSGFDENLVVLTTSMGCAISKPVARSPRRAHRP